MSRKIVYPELCVQSLVSSWWETTDNQRLGRGRLIWVVVPYVSQEPRILVPIGRTDPKDHSRANYQVETIKGTVSSEIATLPVAAFPHHENEKLIVSRAKRRPAIVISTEGLDVPSRLRVGKARHQTATTILIAPFFGALLSAQRAGFNPEFVVRIRSCEYPQYFWDRLPLGGDTEESILRFDHVFPIGNHHAAYEATDWTLSNEALDIVDEWFHWLLTGTLDEKSVLITIRQYLQEEFQVST